MTAQRFDRKLSPLIVRQAVEAALLEDLGRAGDITTDSIVAADALADARLVARKAGVIAGLDLAAAAFLALDPALRFAATAADGQKVEAGALIAEISGNARAVLSGERVALNYLGRLSGIATLTRRYVEAVSGTGAQIVCTRKTTPGLRTLEKYAVRAGGGMNHRFGLDDAILIKDNHIAIAGGVVAAIRAARGQIGHMVKLEVEVDTLDQLREALSEPIDIVLLDNMSTTELKRAVDIVNGRALTEASGGVDLASVRAIAESGVDLISAGALTHSAPVLDLGLDFAVSAT